MIHVSGSFAVGIHFVSIGVYLFFFLYICRVQVVKQDLWKKMAGDTIHRK
jgi:hypothetical protein